MHQVPERLPYFRKEAKCLDCNWSSFSLQKVKPIRNSDTNKQALRHSRITGHEVEVITAVRYKPTN